MRALQARQELLRPRRGLTPRGVVAVRLARTIPSRLPSGCCKICCIKENQGIERLILGTGRHLARHRQVLEKRQHLSVP